MHLLTPNLKPWKNGKKWRYDLLEINNLFDTDVSTLLNYEICFFTAYENSTIPKYNINYWHLHYVW